MDATTRGSSRVIESKLGVRMFSVQAILAPVPCIHIFHALETCATYGKVAFGTDAISFFTDEKRNQVFSAGTVVLIAASRPERGHDEFYKNG
jgi:hypothetical protein